MWGFFFLLNLRMNEKWGRLLQMIFLVSKIAKLSSLFGIRKMSDSPLFVLCMMDGSLHPLCLLFFVVGWNGSSYHLWLSFLLIRYHHLLKRKLSYAYSRVKMYQLRLPHRCKSIMHVFKSDVSNDSFVDSLPFLILTPGELNSLRTGKNLIYWTTFPFPVQPSQVRWFLWWGPRSKESLTSRFLYPNSLIRSFLSPVSHMNHCGSLNIVIHQLRGSHSEFPIYPGPALSAQEGLTLCDLPESVKWFLLNNSLW